MPGIAAPGQLHADEVSHFSHRVFSKLFCKTQFPHKSVNLFFLSVMIKDELTDLCWNRLFQNECLNTLCEIALG